MEAEALVEPAVGLHTVGRVAGGLQQFRKRDLAAVERITVIAKPVQVAVFARQQDGAARCADRIGDEAVREANAVRSNSIDIRCLDEVAAVGADRPLGMVVGGGGAGTKVENPAKSFFENIKSVLSLAGGGVDKLMAYRGECRAAEAAIESDLRSCSPPRMSKLRFAADSYASMALSMLAVARKSSTSKPSMRSSDMSGAAIKASPSSSDSCT